MQRNFEAYLWDIQDRGQQIVAFVGSATEDDYLHNSMLRAAVERNPEVFGEAIVQAKRSFPDEVARIRDFAKVISFRNELAHGYDGLNHHEVWTVIKQSLPLLLSEVDTLLPLTPPRVKE